MIDRTNPRNPALVALDVLIGRWSADIIFPAMPDVPAHARVSFEWGEGGAFVIMHSEIEGDGPPDSMAVIERDDSSDSYHLLYYDERGVSRVYRMELGNGEWRWSRDAPEFAQRFAGTFSRDRNQIVGAWEASVDGQAWEHDFDITYTRVGE